MSEKETTEPIEEPKRDAWQGLDPGPARTAGSPIERGEAIDPRTGNPIADPDNPKAAFDQRDWGSLFNIFFFGGIKNFIKTQNPPVAFSWNSATPLAHGTILDLQSDRAVGMVATDEVDYAPTGLVLNNGTSADVLADLVTMHDGNIYQIDEVGGAPGQSLTLTFTNVVRFNRVAVFMYYMGSATHAIRVQLWNYNTGAWVTFHTIHDNIDFEQHFKTMPDDTNFIQAGTVLMRLYHTEAGSPAHNSFIDYIALSQTAGVAAAPATSYNKLNVGGFIPELHGYMTGLSTAIYAPLPDGTGIGFRVYKNGNPTHCILYVTDDNNDANGLVWSDRFNSNPFYVGTTEGPPAGVHDFLANDRIIIVAEDPEQPPAGMGAGVVNKTMATNIHRLDFWWHFSYEKLMRQLLREILSYPSEGGEFAGVPPGGVGPGDPGNGGNGGGDGSGEGEGSGSDPDIPTQ